MSEHPSTPDQPTPAPAGLPERLSLRAYVERESERMRLSGGPTMGDWLDEVQRYPITGIDTEETVRAIRELRDADQPRDAA